MLFLLKKKFKLNSNVNINNVNKLILNIDNYLLIAFF